MRKILILTNSIDGLKSFRGELIDEFINEGFKVTISAPIGTKIEYFKEIGCEIEETSINRRGTNPISEFKLLVFYYKLIKRVEPDVVLTYTIKPNVYGGMVCRLKGIPQISNVTGLGTAVENKGILQKTTLSLYRIGLKKCMCVFFQNKENMEFMQSNGVGIESGRLIPGSGVNLTHYGLLEYPKSNEINFLYISRIMKEKGIDQYLDAANEWNNWRQARNI